MAGINSDGTVIFLSAWKVILPGVTVKLTRTAWDKDTCVGGPLPGGGIRRHGRFVAICVISRWCGCTIMVRLFCWQVAAQCCAGRRLEFLCGGVRAVCVVQLAATSNIRGPADTGDQVVFD